MDETTIAKPLSGPEVIEAICYKIRENLNKNCLLAPHSAYGAFSFDATIKINFNNPTSLVREAMGFANGSDGAVDQTAETVEENIQIKEAEAPPNQIRRDTEQGVPAMIKTPQGGTTEKRLKYERKDANAAGSGREVASGKGRAKSA